MASAQVKFAHYVPDFTQLGDQCNFKWQHRPGPIRVFVVLEEEEANIQVFEVKLSFQLGMVLLVMTSGSSRRFNSLNSQIISCSYGGKWDQNLSVLTSPIIFGSSRRL
jgi:hypothetical protein